MSFIWCRSIDFYEKKKKKQTMPCKTRYRMGRVLYNEKAN